MLTGFDRIVFKGTILPLAHEEGAMSFLRWRGVLNRDYKKWMQTQTDALVTAVDRTVTRASLAGRQNPESSPLPSHRQRSTTHYRLTRHAFRINTTTPRYGGLNRCIASRRPMLLHLQKLPMRRIYGPHLHLRPVTFTASSCQRPRIFLFFIALTAG